MTRRDTTPQRLPIDDVVPEILDRLANERRIVLRAPTGAGKTTRIAPALLDAGLAGDRAVVLLEPRRIAARAAAARIAHERGTELGKEVGYHVRFDRRASRDTRILVVTEGILLRMLQDDPFLEQVGAILFDEFHERRVDSDLALAMVQKLRRELRPEMPVAVLSATIAVEPIAAWLDDAPIVTSEGRSYPVEIEYRTAGAPSEEAAVVDAVADVLPRTRGDVLVFLAGVGEIRRTRRELQGLAANADCDLVELYGSLPAAEQDVVLQPGERRRIVLATNVAETSVTLPGVTAVVDSGLHRVMRRDAARGLDRLVREPVSKASADQRAGRAGRLEPGLCRRLWTAAEHAARPDHDDPEIRRVDLAGSVLQLYAWGESDVTSFAWFDPPQREALDDAVSLLRRLRALGDHGLTNVGKQLAKIPAHPRIGSLLLAGIRLGHGERAAIAAALLSERNPFVNVASRTARAAGACDLAEGIDAFESNRGDREARRTIRRVSDQLLRAARDAGQGTASPVAHARVSIDPDTAIRRALLEAFPDRVARRRDGDERRGRLVGGRGVRLAPTSTVLEGPLFVCVDIDSGRPGDPEAFVRLASSIEREWLPPDAVTSSVDVMFDEDRRRVVARRRTRYEDLILEEAPAPLPDDDRTSSLLVEAILREPEPLTWFANRELDDFVTRIRCLREWVPDLELPACDDEAIAAALPELVRGCRSFEDLAKVDAVSILRGQWPFEIVRAVDRLAPERLEVPSGSRIRLTYEVGKPPVLAARIQELFGLADTPRIADGRVPILLHLLAPNHRPQQITDDLRSFWDGAYVEIRKELRRRYPKHAWPEDPWSARAERRPQRKKPRG